MIITFMPLICSLRDNWAYSCSVVPVEDVTTGLANEMGMPVAISKDLKGSKVFLVRNGASPTTLLRALATSLHASLHFESGGYTIRVTAQDRKASEEALSSERRKWIVERCKAVTELQARSSIQDISSNLSQSLRVHDSINRGDRISGEAFFVTEQLPSEKLLLSVIKSIGPTTISAVPINRVQVWEDNPTYRALSLPELGDERASYTKAVRDLNSVTLSNIDYAAISKLSMDSFFKDWGKTISPDLRLRLEVRSEAGRVLLRLEGYDREGNRCTFAAMSAMPQLTWKPPASISSTRNSTNPNDWIPVATGGDGNISAAAGDAKLYPRWFTNPEVSDPLNVFASAGLMGLARQESSRCFVAEASDALWYAGSKSIVDGRLHIPVFKDLLLDTLGYEQLTDAGSVIWRTKGNLGSAHNLADRRALGKYARKALATHLVGTDDFVRFARDAGENESTLTLFWTSVLQRNSHVKFGTFGGSHSFCTLLGKIAESDWQQLKAGAAYSIDQLGLRSYLENMWDAQDPLCFEKEHNDLYRHPEELFRNQSVGRSQIRAQAKLKDLVAVKLDTDLSEPTWTDFPSGLPAVSYTMGNDGVITPGVSRKEFELRVSHYLFRFGSRLEYSFRIILEDGVYHEARFFDPISVTSGWRKYGDLPTSSRNAIWASLFRR